MRIVTLALCILRVASDSQAEQAVSSEAAEAPDAESVQPPNGQRHEIPSRPKEEVHEIPAQRQYNQRWDVGIEVFVNKFFDKIFLIEKTIRQTASPIIMGGLLACVLNR